MSQVTIAWIIFIIAQPMSDCFGYSRRGIHELSASWTTLSWDLNEESKFTSECFILEQHLWPKTHKLCAGKLQSPIAISTFKAIPLPLPALEMIGYHDFLPMPQTLINDGRTGKCLEALAKLKKSNHVLWKWNARFFSSVKLAINKNVTREKLPYVFGATLKRNQRYEIEQMHFHWGAKNNRGAEHVLNGVRWRTYLILNDQ